MRRSVVIRCDCGARIGLGHVIRCLALAEALTERDWICSFTGSAETVALPQLRQSGFAARTLADPGDAREMTKGEGPDLLIIDHYGLDAAYEQTCSGWAGAVLVLDDEPVRPHAADMLLDAGYGRVAADYADLVPAGCRILSGPDFALLRPAFAQLRSKSLQRPIGARVRRIYVSFGGIDSHGLCLHALQALANIDEELEIDIVIGACAPHMDKLYCAEKTSRHAVSIHVDTADVAKLLAAADLALGAAGVSAWERCALGVPSIVACAAQNQRSLYDALVASGAAIGAGGPEGDLASAMADVLSQLVHDQARRADMRAKAAAFCDGGGAVRAAQQIEAFISKNGSNAENRTHRSLAS